MGGVTNITPWQMFLMGGAMMWPLLICSLFSLSTIIQKTYFFFLINANVSQLKERVFSCVLKNDFKGALMVCDDTRSPSAKVIKSGLLKFGSSRDEIITAMQEAAQIEIPVLEYGLVALSTVASVAPLLGLLGTVLGFCNVFHVVQLRATVLNPVTTGDVAGGVWQALIATVAGLCVGIPALMAHNFFFAKVRQKVFEMEKAGIDISNFLLRVSAVSDSSNKESD